MTILALLSVTPSQEQIDLAYYVRTNQPLREQSAPGQKSPFAVVVKLPCLAVKYPQSGLRVSISASESLAFVMTPGFLLGSSTSDQVST